VSRIQTKTKSDLAALVLNGARGTLTTQNGERLHVRVAQCDGDVVLLVPVLDPGDTFDGNGGERVLLECNCPHGLARFRGDAEVEDDEAVRFHVFNVLEVLQRRRFFRVSTPRRVEVSNGARVLDACSVDISAGGMLLTGLESAEVGDRIRFRLYLGTDENPIEGEANVVRTTGDGRRAIAFQQFPRHEEERLIRFLFDRQRAERAFTRGDAH